MRRLLYLITSERTLEQDPLFVVRPELAGPPEVVLLQEGVRLANIPVELVSVLGEDLQERGLQSSYPVIGYRELLDKIFTADQVVRL
ncbi:hypothetical protein YTPLAS18_39200 [Nitrospira sp.]|nr:hypothetical protein YTPLAS18_39200 [Nitrospira sp.]